MLSEIGVQAGLSGSCAWQLFSLTKTGGRAYCAPPVENERFKEDEMAKEVKVYSTTA